MWHRDNWEKKNTEKIYINFYWTQKYDMNCFFFVPTHSNAEKTVSHWYHSAWLSNGCLQQFFFCLFFFGRFVCLFAWFAKMCHISSFNCLFFDLYCFIFWFLEELFGRFITYFSEIFRIIFPYTPHFVQDDINVKSAGFWQIKNNLLANEQTWMNHNIFGSVQ